MGRILDFGESLTAYNTSGSADEADCKAVAADWNAVGLDLREAYLKAGVHSLGNQKVSQGDESEK